MKDYNNLPIEIKDEIENYTYYIIYIQDIKKTILNITQKGYRYSVELLIDELLKCNTGLIKTQRKLQHQGFKMKKIKELSLQYLNKQKTEGK